MLSRVQVPKTTEITEITEILSKFIKMFNQALVEFQLDAC